MTAGHGSCLVLIVELGAVSCGVVCWAWDVPTFVLGVNDDTLDVAASDDSDVVRGG